jgi:hypothetical protein
MPSFTATRRDAALSAATIDAIRSRPSISDAEFTPGRGGLSGATVSPVRAAYDPAELDLAAALDRGPDQSAVADQLVCAGELDGAPPEPIGLVARAIAHDLVAGTVTVERRPPVHEGVRVAKQRAAYQIERYPLSTRPTHHAD